MSLPKLKLRTALVVPFLLQIVTAVGLVSYFSFRSGEQAVDELAAQLTEETSARIKQHVVNHLDQSQNTLRLTYAGVQSGNLDLKDFAKLRRYFWEVVKPNAESASLSYGNSLSFGNEQGEFVVIENRGRGVVQLKIRTAATAPIRRIFIVNDQGEPETLVREKAYDPRVRPWYQAAQKAGKPTWSPIYSFFSSRNTALGISPVYPVYDADNNFQGVLCVNVRLTRITDFINDLFVSENGQSFIMERSGELIASSKIEQPFQVIGTGKQRKIERIQALQSDYPTIQAATQAVMKRLGSLGKMQEGLRFRFQVDGHWNYAHIRPIQDGRGIDWLGVVVVPEQDVMGAIQQNVRNTWLLCLVALGGAIALGLFTARWLSHPILSLTTAAGEMAAGNLDQKVGERSRIIELNRVAHVFNSMASQLKELIDTLEEKVAERTTKLASANAQITTLNDQLKAENLRLGAELDVARQIQKMVLPKPEELNNIPGLDIAGFMEPADEVGGDYYDVLQTDGIVTLGIGDVTGHGLESGLLMLMTQTAVRALQEVQEQDPIRFLDTLNRTIYANVRRMDSEKNLTLAILNYCNRRISISGQHEETLIARADGSIERIDTIDLGLPIGLERDIVEFIDHYTLELSPGDGVVLYTDGIPEAYNIDKQQYGMERFCAIISQHWHQPAENIQQAIVEDVRTFIGEQKVFDDITLLVLKQR